MAGNQDKGAIFDLDGTLLDSMGVCNSARSPNIRLRVSALPTLLKS